MYIYTCVCIYIYIYMYACRHRHRPRRIFAHTYTFRPASQAREALSESIKSMQSKNSGFLVRSRCAANDS